ncbi:27002_t:CDS:2, partial [Gigaspora margarita]
LSLEFGIVIINRLRVGALCLGGIVIALVLVPLVIVCCYFGFPLKITNNKLKSSKLISTAINLSYLKKAAPKHEDLQRDKYNKASSLKQKIIINEPKYLYNTEVKTKELDQDTNSRVKTEKEVKTTKEDFENYEKGN